MSLLYMYTMDFNYSHLLFPLVPPLHLVLSFLFLSNPSAFHGFHFILHTYQRLAIVGPENFTYIFHKKFKF